MRFHLSSEFNDAISAAADYFKIREAYIEKDYWVTYVLNNLSNSKLKDKVVFKGGTSLSKVHKCIERFSEDNDLAIIEDEGMGDSKRKNLMKEIEATVSQGLIEIKDHPQTEKRGKNRKTFYKYPEAVEKKNMGLVKDVIQLEINSFTKPDPYSKMQVESLISQYLRENNFADKIELNNLRPFEIIVLSIERTFFEKILSLIRLSYENIETLRSKIKHFYDIVKILKYNKTILDNENSFEILKNAFNDDNTNSTFSGDWLNKPISEAPLFTNFENLWESLDSVYKNDLKDLIWTDIMPSNNEVKESIMKIREFVVRFQNK